jgi:hypothetical protein
MPTFTSGLLPSTQVSMPDTPKPCEPNTTEASLFCKPEKTSSFDLSGSSGASVGDSV